MRGNLPWHPSSNDALESFHRGCPGAAQQVSMVPHKESLKGASHNSQRGKNSMALRLCSLHEGAVMHRLQPEPTSDPRRDFRCLRYWFRYAGGNCRALGLKSKSSLCSQTSVLTCLAQKPSRWQFRIPQCSTLPDL